PPTRTPHSFPTRRSSDLDGAAPTIAERALQPVRQPAPKWHADRHRQRRYSRVILTGGFSQVQDFVEVIVHPIEEEVLEITNSRRSEEHTSELQSRFDLVC